MTVGDVIAVIVFAVLVVILVMLEVPDPAELIGLTP